MNSKRSKHSTLDLHGAERESQRLAATWEGEGGGLLSGSMCPGAGSREINSWSKEEEDRPLPQREGGKKRKMGGPAFPIDGRGRRAPWKKEKKEGRVTTASALRDGEEYARREGIREKTGSVSWGRKKDGDYSPGGKKDPALHDPLGGERSLPY